MLQLFSADLFQINFLRKFLLGTLAEYQRIWIQIKIDLDLHCFQKRVNRILKKYADSTLIVWHLINWLLRLHCFQEGG